MRNIGKSTLREIRSSFGRFMAILAIIGLGVGFFSGLKVTKSAMVYTMKDYLDEHGFYDYRLLSSLGIDKEEAENVRKQDDVEAAEGVVSFDILYQTEDGSQGALKTISLTKQVNTVNLVAGRMPKKGNECLADQKMMKESDIGSILTISADNEEGTKESFTYSNYKVVGLVRSPLYIQYERGNTSLSSGQLDGYIYLLPDGYNTNYYTEIDVRFRQDCDLYGEEYDSYIDEKEKVWERLLSDATDRRLSSVQSEMRENIDAARKDFSDRKAAAQQALADGRKKLADGRKKLAAAATEEERKELEKKIAEGEQTYNSSLALFEEKVAEGEKEIAEAEEKLRNLKTPDTYLLGRNANVGYRCFENDSNIVEGIALVFPVFFFLVAALVCITTMNRMVDEQRTQIGVLKALGYSGPAIMSKYMLYSGLAAGIGCVLGFGIGTWGFPRVIWQVYGIMYQTRPLYYIFDGRLACISFLVALFCSIGTTWLSCRVELLEAAAQLMRPKAPKAGKRIILERITFFWKRLSFLRKVSIRNIFRYKKRLFMMILGISGCTALLVTGFGIRDSISDVAERQYEDIFTYDINVSFREPVSEETMELMGEAIFLSECHMDFVTKKGTKSVRVVAADPDRITGYVDFHTRKGKPLDYPSDGAILTHRIAEQYGVRVGDEITLRDEKLKTMTVKVSAVMENFFNDYVYLSEETWQRAYGRAPEKKSAYMKCGEDADLYQISAGLLEIENVAGVTVNRDIVERVGNMMSRLNVIVIVVILCAAGLAFIVLYNLTNINITERIREIATIKVLGFYMRETRSYVFRENLLLTVFGMILGLFLGNLLHAYVMSQIRIDLITFAVRVEPVSYLSSAALTIVFVWIVNLFMGPKMEKISMTESLKSVD